MINLLNKDIKTQSIYTVFSKYYQDYRKIIFESSFKIDGNKDSLDDRLSCWMEGNKPEDFTPFTELLIEIEAPQQVIDAQKNDDQPYRQGIGVDFSNKELEMRLYLHGRNSKTNKDQYKTLKWQVKIPIDPNVEVIATEYEFYYYSGIPGEVNIENLLPTKYHGILDNQILKLLSGFWVRKNEQGTITRIFCALPNQPTIGNAPGVLELLQNIGYKDIDKIKDIHIRSFGFDLTRDETNITFYVPGKFYKDYPKFEEIAEKSQAINKVIHDSFHKIWDALPQLRAFVEKPDAFTEGLQIWEQLFGKNKQRHFGLSSKDGTDIFENALSTISQHFKSNASIYEVGCDWGASLNYLSRNKNAKVVGTTNSPTQFLYVHHQLGHRVRYGDGDTMVIPGHFDAVLLLESFSNIQDKEKFLTMLRSYTEKIVMRVNCNDSKDNETLLLNGAFPISSKDLFDLFRRTGWNISFWKNRRQESMESLNIWKNRLPESAISGNKYLKNFQDKLTKIQESPERWGRLYPLIEVVAEKMAND